MENAIVISGFIGMLLFFFPIFTDGVVLYRRGRVGFAISLFSLIRLFGGYSVLDKEGVMIHLSEKKAIFLPFKDLEQEKRMMDWKQGFQLHALYLLVEYDKRKDSVIPFSVMGETSVRILFDRLKARHPFMRLRSDLVLSEGEFSLCARVKVLTNLFTLTRAAVKIITGRIITALWKKKRKPMKT